MSKTKSTKQKKTTAAAKTKPVKDIALKDTPQGEPSTAMQAALASVAAMPPPPAKDSKLGLLITLLTRPEGATIDDMVTATNWQKHTVRSAVSHALAKKRGYLIVSDKPLGGQRLYKIVDPV